MLNALNNQIYRHLFLAQVLAMLGTGITTIGLVLLAYELAGDRASTVLGTALALAMAAYLCVVPLVRAYARRLPRQPSLVALDLIRGAVVLSLPFVKHVWPLYALTLLLHASSAASIQILQTTITDVLPVKSDSGRALSLSRPGYDIESLLSPVVAAVLLAFVSITWLFGLAAAGFLASAALLLSVHLPASKTKPAQYSALLQPLRGISGFLRTPRFRGKLALDMSAAAGSAMVVVNTVAYVQGTLHRSSIYVAVAVATFGLGSLLVATVVMRLLGRRSERLLMALGASLTTAGLFGGAGIAQLPGEAAWAGFLAVVLVIGVGYSMVQTFGGHMLQREPGRTGQPPAFVKHFTLSHACWLIAYPLAGHLASRFGLGPAFLLMGSLSALGLFTAVATWGTDGVNRASP